ncbi:amino acid ABC transporter permease [Nocardioides jejuensis]|uniref:Amino acid ABC transporter permease n=1 Tax=Nocardioides jejuensis TaxID=2502782 RepID=A0A4R1CJD5_9ACTN|nr:amino acid ABC transporter permease [Nocardioides jejuensis]
MYALLGAVVLVVVFAVDWASVRNNFWADGQHDNWRDLITTGVVNTARYTAIAFAGGLTLAFALALMKLSPIRIYRWIATAYVEFFRGLPALIVILVMAFGVPIAFQWTPPGGPVGAGVVGLIMVAGAYMAETLRAGIQSVPKGQAEAARSLGMSGPRTMVSIVIPQAVRIVIPPLTNEFVLLIKDTALLFVVGMLVGQRELTTIARDFMASGSTAGTATSLTQAALLYLIITLPLTRLVAWLEKKQQRAR